MYVCVCVRVRVRVYVNVYRTHFDFIKYMSPTQLGT